MLPPTLTGDCVPCPCNVLNAPSPAAPSAAPPRIFPAVFLARPLASPDSVTSVRPTAGDLRLRELPCCGEISCGPRLFVKCTIVLPAGACAKGDGPLVIWTGFAFAAMEGANGVVQPHLRRFQPKLSRSQLEGIIRLLPLVRAGCCPAEDGRDGLPDVLRFPEN